METNEPSTKDKTKRGRPLKFKNVKDLDIAIQLYFDKCDPHIEKRMVATGTSPTGHTMFEQRDIITEQKPYTMSGLARALEIDRRTLLNYKMRDEFFPSIQQALSRCEEYAESQLFEGNANGAKFSLTNNFDDWADKRELEHTTPEPILGGTTPLPEDDGDDIDEDEESDSE